MKPRNSWGCIPTLTVSAEELTDNEAKAHVFMDSFFPKMGGAQEELSIHVPPEIQWQPITELEVYQFLRVAKSSTVPDEDNLLTLV